MTPFGEAVRRLRRQRGVSQKQMAAALSVTPAYLSALENGHRGRPSFDFLQRVAGYFNIIWDEADDLFRLAAQSHPRVVVDTTGLPAEYTAFANRLACEIRSLSPEGLAELAQSLDQLVFLREKAR
ncbi:transcriptional regulator with XRE-family HTH domain [Rhizobium sp. SG_E_25_P2]|jgi:transcriptional regulator with XRE-family HTH domain|uniref:helix-turn-helix domain-containing protein n=1 Tax=Rhizobium sp. SG_E_25_P2 TaxID=2879942 RepID=UPI002474F114|nr:helix-turn-helix transcriptional regulator [Rhizobium sp. SG_E_25_P2]MDH6269331.1 transcriptional regulator with XRE-family HTH domain [Rhizobium sp. SG_E_25_P2]